MTSQLTRHPTHLAVRLERVAEDALERAKLASSGRAAITLTSDGHALRQTVIALTAGSELAEHESPGAATLQVLRGEVVLSGASTRSRLRVSDLAHIPPERHALSAATDAVVLLTVGGEWRSSSSTARS